LGRTATLTRSANLTQSLNGRGPCHYCGPCERGCVTKSYFNSAFTTVADALKSGNCTLISNAMAFKVLMDPDRNRARGVLYIDRVTRAPREIQARAIILCASAKSHSHPQTRQIPVSQWPLELQRRSRSLPHGHVRGAGGGGGFPSAAPSLGAPVKPGFVSSTFTSSQPAFKIPAGLWL
jgi:hypothetical protein